MVAYYLGINTAEMYNKEIILEVKLILEEKSRNTNIPRNIIPIRQCDYL